MGFIIRASNRFHNHAAQPDSQEAAGEAQDGIEQESEELRTLGH